MKLIMLIFLSINIFAQDSSIVSLALNNSDVVENSLFNKSIPKTTSLIELKSGRHWKKSITPKLNSKLNEMSNIEFVKQDESFVDSDLFLILVGSTIALGASAAYFKLESDNYYEKYQNSNDKYYLNKTDKYDLYSGVSLGVMQVNFGYLIYKFLTD